MQQKCDDLIAENKCPLVLIYYAGHGVIGADGTRIILNMNPDEGAHEYPIEAKLEELATYINQNDGR